MKSFSSATEILFLGHSQKITKVSEFHEILALRIWL